jgi:hypothetical protein
MAGGDRKLKTPTGAILSKYLRALALEIHTLNKDGDPQTKAAALAELVWDYALGHTEKDVKTGTEVKVAPAVWAIECLYNRIEGKIPVAVIEDQGRSLTEKVSDLGKAKINAMAKAAAEAKEEDGSDE